MRRLLIVLATFIAFSAAAQEQPVRRFAVEVGAGLAPIHYLLLARFPYKRETALVEQGIRASEEDSFPMALSAAGVFSINEKTEITVTGSVTWRHYNLTQYPEFGTDPYGRPRYDTAAGVRMEKGINEYCVALSVSGRHAWHRRQHVRLYTGVGLGVVGAISERAFFPVPELIPIGMQLGGSRLYAFIENTLGPHATLGRGGIGYRF